PDRQREERQHVPILAEPARRGHELLGQPGQRHAEVPEDLFELRDDIQHDERQDADGHQDDDHGIDHGAGDAAFQGLRLLFEVGETWENRLEGAAGLALLGPLPLAFTLARLDLRDLGHEVTHLADLLLGFFFADGVYGVFYFSAGRVHRLEFEGRHREPQLSGQESVVSSRAVYRPLTYY